MTQQLDSSHKSAGITLTGTPPLVASSTAALAQPAYCTELVSTGKFYWEITTSTAGATRVAIGSSAAAVTDGTDPGSSENASAGYSNLFGNISYRSGFSYSVPTTGAGALVGVAWSVRGGVNLLWISDVAGSPGVWYGASTSPGDPVAETGGADLTANGGITGSSWSPGVGLNGNPAGATFVFSAPFTGPVPSGYGPFDAVASGGGGLLLFGGSVMCGWTPAPLLGAAAAWKAGQAIRRNATLSRRALIGKK